MKQITITINVPDDTSEFRKNELIRQCEMLASPDWISVFWGIDDVKSVAEHLSDDEAREVLETADRRHDADIGINWTVLETIADMLFDMPDDEEDELSDICLNV
jgi:hypothetical protein